LKNRSTLIYCVDVTNLYGTFHTEIFNFCVQKNLKLILIINKLDALPEGYI